MTARDTPGEGFTPGPWKLWQATSDHSLNVVNEKSEFICEVGVLGKDGDTRDARIKADGNLIAAAPDLLAACEKALYALKGREHDGFLRDAIKKATGL